MTSPTAPPRCPTCGNEGPTSGKGFCEVCGEFVDWGALVDAARDEALQVETARADAARERAARQQAERDTAARAEIERLEAERVEADPADPQTPVAAPPNPSTPPSATDRSRARELLVPLADDVRPVLPGRPDPTQPDLTPVGANDESGIVCWNCGVGNRPDRRFCRNCGVDLSTVPATAAPSGPSRWRRLLDWLRRHRLRVGILVGLVVLALLAALVLPRLLADDQPVVLPIEASASSSDLAHPAVDAFDENPSTFWRSAASRDGETLTAQFSRPIDIGATRFSAAPGDAGRPRSVRLRITDTSGRTTTFSAQLRDGGTQQVATATTDVVRVSLEIDSVYAPGADRRASVAELAFVGSGG